MLSWILLAAAVVPANAEDDKPILTQMIELPTIRTNSINLDGMMCAEWYNGVTCDRRTQIQIVKVKTGLNIEAKIDGLEPFVVDVPLATPVSLDLMNAEFHGAYEPEVTLFVEINFGEQVDCYANEVRNNRLFVTFEEGHTPTAILTTYTDCEIRKEWIVGDEEKE